MLDGDNTVLMPYRNTKKSTLISHVVNSLCIRSQTFAQTHISNSHTDMDTTATAAIASAATTANSNHTNTGGRTLHVMALSA